MIPTESVQYVIQFRHEPSGKRFDADRATSAREGYRTLLEWRADDPGTEYRIIRRPERVLGEKP